MRGMCTSRRLLALAAAAIAAATLHAQPPQTRFDVLIRNGRIVDGTGAPWFRGDVAISGDRIAAVGPLAGATAAITIDARSEEHTLNSSHLVISYAVFCLKKKKESHLPHPLVSKLC